MLAALSALDLLCAPLNVNELCWKCLLHFTDYQHVHSSVKININDTFVNPVGNVSLVWLKQTFTHAFTKRLINKAHCLYEMWKYVMAVLYFGSNAHMTVYVCADFREPAWGTAEREETHSLLLYQHLLLPHATSRPQGRHQPPLWWQTQGYVRTLTYTKAYEY